MKRSWAAPFLIATAAAGLGGCDRGEMPLAAYKHRRDALAAALPLDIFGIYPCSRRRKIHGRYEIVSLPVVDQCYRMSSPRRFRGIWLDEFEGSGFFEGARNIAEVKRALQRPEKEASADRVWLDWPGPAPQSLAAPSQQPRLIAIDFIGRRTAFPGHYGHMGVSRSEVLVDRVISARVIYTSDRIYFEDELQPR